VSAGRARPSARSCSKGWFSSRRPPQRGCLQRKPEAAPPIARRSSKMCEPLHTSPAIYFARRTRRSVPPRGYGRLTQQVRRRHHPTTHRQIAELNARNCRARISPVSHPCRTAARAAYLETHPSNIGGAQRLSVRFLSNAGCVCPHPPFSLSTRRGGPVQVVTMNRRRSSRGQMEPILRRATHNFKSAPGKILHVIYVKLSPAPHGLKIVRQRPACARSATVILLTHGVYRIGPG
jgi:hypothetical protein